MSKEADTIRAGISPTYNTSNSFFDDDDLTDEEVDEIERAAVRHYIHCIEYIALYSTTYGIKPIKETPNV